MGSVALFMPTQPEGDYKLDLRAFADRQIVTLLLGEHTILVSYVCTRESVTGCSDPAVPDGHAFDAKRKNSGGDKHNFVFFTM